MTSAPTGAYSSATALTMAIGADPGAALSYDRSVVRTLSKDGKGSLNVASAQLKRPPAGSLMAPLEVLAPTSPYGIRTSPITGSPGEFHWGQDYSAPCGTRVYSADAGVVRAVGWHQWGGGNRVEIDHGNGLITTYNHLEGIAVKAGESVEVGEVIARVGTTGSSTGCHLHFETILNGSHTNPSEWKMLPIKQLDELGQIDMVTYSPSDQAPGGGAPNWAIPATPQHNHPPDEHATNQPVESGPDTTIPEPAKISEPATPEPIPAAAPSPGPTGAASAPAAPEPSDTTTPTTEPAPQPSPTQHADTGEAIPTSPGA